jgi:hypothetical protein
VYISNKNSLLRQKGRLKKPHKLLGLYYSHGSSMSVTYRNILSGVSTEQYAIPSVGNFLRRVVNLSLLVRFAAFVLFK